jgi:predicted nucleic acid-binding protein
LRSAEFREFPGIFGINSPNFVKFSEFLSPIVIPPTVIIRTLMPGPFTSNVLSLLALWQRRQQGLIAPALLAFEVTSTLRRLVYLRELTPDKGEDAFVQFLRIRVRLTHRQSLFPLAWGLAKQYQRPRAYDTAYLTLAQLHQCESWPADERLYNAVQHDLGWVK